MGKLEKIRTNTQHKTLFGLLHKLNQIHLRGDLAFSFSGGRVSSTSKLFESECKALINHLREEIKKAEPEQPRTKLDKMIGKFFYYCHELNWKKGRKLDYPKINNWLLESSYLKKLLDEYSEQEMPKLLLQIERLLYKKTAAIEARNNKPC